jgi:hypothetical protein
VLLAPLAHAPPYVDRSGAGHPIEDQNSAITVTAISAVPVHPKKVSIGRALKRPITERRVTTPS